LLETLTIHGSTTGHTLSGVQILELLRAAPNLVECIFDGVYPTYFEDMDEIVILPTLRRWMFGIHDENPINDTEILSRLSLPKLEILSFSFHHTYIDDFISFLERSSPPLRELVAFIGFGVGFTGLAECLHLVPTITHLEARWPGTSLATELFAALADSPSLLPNLIGLTVRPRNFDTSSLYAPDTAESLWKTLLRALSARRTQLRVVRVKLMHGSLSSSLKPAADILAAFRELAADGMELYIGTDGCNFVSG
jgi:hypothetical protein